MRTGELTAQTRCFQDRESRAITDFDVVCHLSGHFLHFMYHDGPQITVTFRQIVRQRGAYRPVTSNRTERVEGIVFFRVLLDMPLVTASGGDGWIFAMNKWTR